MSQTPPLRPHRRGFLLGGVALGASLSAPAVFAQASSGAALVNATDLEADLREETRRNITSFRVLEWRNHFDNLRGGAILADTVSRCVHFWSEDEQTYRIYPSSVPMTEELTRTDDRDLALRNAAVSASARLKGSFAAVVVDPVTHTAELKVCPVRLEPLTTGE